MTGTLIFPRLAAAIISFSEHRPLDNVKNMIWDLKTNLTNNSNNVFFTYAVYARHK